MTRKKHKSSLSEVQIIDMERDLSFSPADPAQAKTLTRDQVERFNRDGYVMPFKIFNGDAVTANRAYFDTLIEKVLVAEDGRDAYAINGYQTSCRSIYDLVRTPAILDLVEDLLGPNIVSWGTQYFCKLPGDSRRVSLHQDAVYWPLTPARTVTAWLAIDDTDVGNGCMEVIPGTHVMGPLDFTPSTSEERNVLSTTVVNVERLGEAVPFDLKAGEISLHSDMLVHGSAPNVSDRRRCGFTIRYASMDVRGDWNDESIICRGTDPGGYWADIPRPIADDPIPKSHQVAQ